MRTRSTAAQFYLNTLIDDVLFNKLMNLLMVFVPLHYEFIMQTKLAASMNNSKGISAKTLMKCPAQQSLGVGQYGYLTINYGIDHQPIKVNEQSSQYCTWHCTYACGHHEACEHTIIQMLPLDDWSHPQSQSTVALEVTCQSSEDTHTSPHHHSSLAPSSHFCALSLQFYSAIEHMRVTPIIPGHTHLSYKFNKDKSLLLYLISAVKKVVINKRQLDIYQQQGSGCTVSS